MGISVDPTAYSFRRLNPLEAIADGAVQTWQIISATVRFLGKIILGKESVDQLGGPIKMAQFAGQSVMFGFDSESYDTKPDLLTMIKVSLVEFISLAALVSVSIGFLNLLPIPVLDGGHLMFYAFEAIAGKPLGPRTQAAGFRIGLVLLLSFMVFVTWNDVSNLLFK